MKGWVALMSVDYNKALNYAIMLANEVSPTGTEQVAFVEMNTKMYFDGLSPKQRLSHLISAIKDGVDNNNWPVREKAGK